MMGVVVEGRKSLRQPWNKRTHFLYSGAGCAMLDVSDAPEGSIYFGCPLTQHLQLFNLLCAKERSSQRACVWEKVIVLGGVRGCDKFHDSLTPAGTACTDPSTDEGGVGVGSLPKNATSTFSSGAPPRVVRWVVNNAVLPLGCCC